VGEASEPLLKKHNATAARDAVRLVWGPGAVTEVMQRMPDRERVEIFADVLPPMIPFRAILELGYAIWDGPAKHSRPEYFKFLHKQTDMSFGRVRKLLLTTSTPEKLISMADELWKSDHTHGSWETAVAPRRARMVLSGHPFADTPHARTSLSEQIRYIIQLTRVQHVTESHARLAPGVLEITLRWK
jgi:hypothetical protein